MKNFLLLFASTKTEELDCIDLSGYSTASDPADWLRQNGDDVCQSVLYAAAQKDHIVDPREITILPGASLRKEYSQVKAMINGFKRYQFYIGFTTNGNDITGWRTLTHHTKFEPCYSIVLFRSIIDNLSSSSYFIFKNGSISHTPTIIIEVHDGGAIKSFYDFSNEPTFVGKIRSEL